MILNYCEKCNNEIPKPLLTQADKAELMQYIHAKMPLQAVYLVRQKEYLDLKDAKLFVDHVCTTFGQCHNCNCEGLKNEYEVCPKCRALNINWK